MQVNRFVIACVAGELDDALRLAEAIGADEVGPLRLARNRSEQTSDLGLGRFVAKDGKREGRLGDEHVARHDLERRAGRVGGALVVAGDNGALAVPVEHHLRGAEDVPSGRETHVDAVDRLRRAVRQGLEGAGALRPHAHLHDLDGFVGRQHGPVAGARVIRVAMRNDGAIDRA
jgi:hypothetical protein